MVNPTDRQPSDEVQIPEITVTAATVEREVERVGFYLGKLEDMKNRNVSLVFPAGLDIQGKSNLGDYEALTRAEFDPDFYNAGLERVREALPVIQQAVEVLGDYQEAWGFSLGRRYSITLTRYGTGGSYYTPRHALAMRTDSHGDFQKSEAASTPIHEVTHMCLEHLVQKYNLEFQEKEDLVNGVDAILFPDICDPKGVLTEEEREERKAQLMNLPEIISSNINNKRASKAAS